MSVPICEVGPRDRLRNEPVGGIERCPFTPRATGNITAEELLDPLDEEGGDTGIDIDEVTGSRSGSRRHHVTRSNALPAASRIVPRSRSQRPARRSLPWNGSWNETTVPGVTRCSRGRA